MIKNLLKRIRNLWNLSSLEIKPGLYEFKSNLEVKRKMAQIIYKKDIIDTLNE